MEILWPLGVASVKEVWQKVDPARGLAYTTVMTVLDKLHRKGVLNQRKKGKAYLYSPIIDRAQALHEILDYLRNAFFQGSRQDLIKFVNDHYALEPPAASPKKDDLPA